MSCRHKNVVIIGSDETGARAARCSDCCAPLTRRIEGSKYIYFRDDRDDQDNARANRKVNP